MNRRRPTSRHDQATIVRARECGDAAFDLASVTYTDRAQLHAECRRGGLNCGELATPSSRAGFPNDRRSFQPRHHLLRDSPDESQTGINVRVFPALLQDRREVLTATSTSGNPNAWSRV